MRLGVALAIGVLVACSPSPVSPPPGYEFPISGLSGGNSGPSAALVGELVVEKPCLYIRPDADPGTLFVVGWPVTSRLDIDASGGPVVVDDDIPVARDGDRIALGGAAYEGETEDFGRSRLRPTSSCQGPVWLATDVIIPED